ncbi:hypothetical protein Q8F55_008034 [Vanrija albida]|uniref:Phospholipase C n=1 Tax=Vanrija albida TaxID=181172 RepID=A0ABR3PV36_9TREE
MASLLLSALVAASAVAAAPDARGGLASLDHIILFMQENRAFDHYFGTMAGVRGFGDPNAVIAKDTNKTSFYSPINTTNTKPAPPANVPYLLPWHFNHQGGNANDRYQCASAGSNGWTANHNAWDGGNNNKWASKNTPYSLGYYRREDTPFHWALAEGWTVADAYHESVISSTNPNRISWVGGTIGVLQSKAGLGGPSVDNYETPGCETAPDGSKYSCYPYKWKTLPEYLEAAGISWQVYQDRDNFDDNPLAWFDQFQRAPQNSSLAQKGLKFVGLSKFYADARNGTLPAVSFIVGPTALSEHTPYGPLDGAWLQQQVVNAITQGKAWDKSALVVSYDETGGWADHVLSPLPPTDTADEWINDPFTAGKGQQPVGPGFRVPFYVVSPYTRNGGVFSEVSSHESQILLVEKWAAAKGKGFHFADIGAWRRSHISDLTRIFDFSKADTSIPAYEPVRQATQDPKTGLYNGAATCAAKYGGGQPTVPYTQADGDAWVLEKGFKKVRGNPGEGHFYVLVCGKQALTFNANANMAQLHQVSDKYDDPSQRFVFHAVDATPNNTRFRLQPFGRAGVFIGSDGKAATSAEAAAIFTITDQSNGRGFSVDCVSGSAGGKPGYGNARCKVGDKLAGVQLFSVSY